MDAILASLTSFDHLGFFAVWFACVLAAALAIVALWTRLNVRSESGRSHPADPPRGG